MRKFLSGVKESFQGRKLVSMLVLLLSLVILVVIDILTKYFAHVNLRGNPDLPLSFIPGLIDLNYTANTGAAWNMLAEQKWILTMISLVLGTAILVYLLFSHSKNKIPVSIFLTLMVAGAYGNLIDRIGYWAGLGMYSEGVIDFLQFSFWRGFPIFNLADSYLVVGIFGLLVYYIVFYVKEELGKNRKVEEETKEEDLSSIISQGLDTEDGKDNKD